MRQTWRWFGPNDPVTLAHIRQAGVEGIVTALHEYAPGQVWPAKDIEARKSIIEASGLTWDVCESIWMPDAIKLKGSAAKAEIDAWLETMQNLAAAGVKTICYNFMPLLDWTRTDLNFEIHGQGRALRFDLLDFVAYDVHILARPNAAKDYSEDILKNAKQRFDRMAPTAQEQLEQNIIAGLPGSASGFSRNEMLAGIAEFSVLSHSDLHQNLASFLSVVVPQAEALGVCLAIHPDDPPFPLFGLPRCVSTAQDFRTLLSTHPSNANGLTFCTGSLSARADNDLPAMASEFAELIHFAHLRNVKREPDGSFHEADVFDGSANMIAVVQALLDAEKHGATRSIPMRPDHGHLLDFEQDQKVNPGYSYLGRLKGLAELRGVIQALKDLENQADKSDRSR